MLALPLHGLAFYLRVTLALLALVGNLGNGAEIETLRSFNFLDAGHPRGALVQDSDGFIYGTAEHAGPQGGNGPGVIYALGTNLQFGVIAQFVVSTNSGRYPRGLLLANDGKFYGVTYNGTVDGISGRSTVFRFFPRDGITTLAGLVSSNGWGADSALVQTSDDTFYGTAVYQGTGWGTIFKYSTNGTITTVVSFDQTNGANPRGRLLEYDGFLYGTTVAGGENNLGTVFKLSLDGTLTTLASFSQTNGAKPFAGLTKGQDGKLYGTTSEGGTTNKGTLFRLSTNGPIESLFAFQGTNGATPLAELILAADGKFYGAAAGGGAFGRGTLFCMDTNGSFNTLATFNGTNGTGPYNALLQAADGRLYGTTYSGGHSNAGTLFRVSIPQSDAPRLHVQSSGNKLVLRWPTNGTYGLQSTHALASPPVWTDSSNAVTIIETMNVVTNDRTNALQFFRLKSPPP